MKAMVIIYMAALLATPALLAVTFFPLAEGNTWTYAESGAGGFTIAVGPAVEVNGRTYYPLTGYGPQRYLVRTDESGALVAVEETNGTEFPLAGFEPGRTYQTSASGCAQSAQVGTKPVDYTGPAGRFEGLQIDYHGTQCADIGFEQELYGENIGLLRRTITTIAGPRQYDLVAARIGRLLLESAPGAAARLNVSEVRLTRASAAEAPKLDARFEIFIDRTDPLVLTFGSAQRADLVVRDQAGRELLRWSDGMMFAMLVGTEKFDGLRQFPLPVTLQDRSGHPLPDGNYIAEAYLKTIGGQPQFRAAVAFSLATVAASGSPAGRTAAGTAGRSQANGPGRR